MNMLKQPEDIEYAGIAGEHRVKYLLTPICKHQCIQNPNMLMLAQQTTPSPCRPSRSLDCLGGLARRLLRAAHGLLRHSAHLAGSLVGGALRQQQQQACEALW